MHTIEELEGKSNFEINKLVAEEEGVKWHLSPYSKSNDTPHWIYCDNWDSVNGDSIYLPDYCNSWGDMGQIIEYKKICLVSNESGGEWVAFLDEFDTIMASNESPLRAAAIVYLMMEN